MKTLLKLLTLLLSFLSVASGVLHYLRIRRGWMAFLVLPKLVTSSFSPLLAVIGGLSANLAKRLRFPLAEILGNLGAFLHGIHVARVIAPHDGFERAFGSDWQARIPPRLHTRLLPQRYTPFIPFPPNIPFEQNIAFAVIPNTRRKLLCDVWEPPIGVKHSGVAVIYFHGSAWHYLDKDFGTRFFFSHLAAQGHVVMDVAYRLCPETDLIGMCGDVRRAVAWMKTNATRYGVSPDKIVLAGGSAGAHLALLNAYTPNHPALTPEDVTMDTRVSGVISYYGPADLRALWDYMVDLYSDHPRPRRRRNHSRLNPLAPVLSQIVQHAFHRPAKTLEGRGTRTYKDILYNLVGGLPHEVPAMYDLGSPITHVGAHCPPTLQLHGLHDSLVPTSASKRLHHALKSAGVPSILVELPLVEHAFDLVILPQISPAAQAALYDVDRFLALMAGN